MRPLAALLGFLTFANLSVVQASGSCPLAAGHREGAAVSAPTSHHGSHGGHVQSVSSDAESVDDAPAPAAGSPVCFMMGPCGLNVDVGRAIVTSPPLQQSDGVRAGSDPAPASLTTSPDIPPPRA